MKLIKNSRIALTLLMAVFAFSLSNCVVTHRGVAMSTARNSRRIPPGQAKKMAGQQSARNFAPGHNK